MHKRSALLYALLLLGGSTPMLCTAEPFMLARDGATDYAVVPPAVPSAVDEYAVKVLTNFLFQKTGAVFPVVAPGQATPAGRHIFVGISKPALERLGVDPLAPLKDQEYVARSVGADIALYGEGMHGTLHAVLDFMENMLGWRWYTDGIQFGPAASQREPGEGEPVFTVERNLAVTPFNRKRRFAFAYRQLTYARLFHYLHGMNMGFGEQSPDGVTSKAIVAGGSHTLFYYIPPHPADRHADRFEWLKKKNYFETHPEFFSMNQTGTRVVNLQLCFSNPDLRQALTRNVLEHIRVLREDRDDRALIVDISAMDNPSSFCHCPECKALEEKYRSPGGPLFDYLFELCPLVNARHPNTKIRTLAYRLSQTQKPPVMPDGQAFPDNLIVQFANIQDDVDKDWNHPNNRPSYEDLLAWARLTPNLWTWYYPNSYYNGGSIPTGNNIARMVTDLRLMKKAGVQGVFIEQGSLAVPGGFNFTELQTYIYLQLLKDIDRDVTAVIREFTDHQYGAAAPLTRTYLDELEAAQKAASEDTSLSAGRSINRVMTGLTPAMLRRWQDYFDRMERLTAADPLRLKNVRRLRQTLDYTTLEHWSELAKAYPETFRDYRVVKARLAPTPPHWGFDAMVEEWEMTIRLAGTEKPLPAPFDAMDKSLVRRFVPVRTPRWDTVGGPKRVVDPEAAFGYGTVVDAPNSPFSFGFYQQDTKTRGPTVVLNPGEMESSIYRLHPLGEIQVSPDSIVWFGWSWSTQLQVGERLYRPPSPDNDNRYDAFVSLKFVDLIDGYKHYPHHSSPPPEQDFSVLCDQIIFVKKPVE